MRTVTELTGVRPDNFMVADFNAVKTLTSAVGGVEVCLAKDINDPDSHLNLPAGKHTIEARTPSPSSAPGTPSASAAT